LKQLRFTIALLLTLGLPLFHNPTLGTATYTTVYTPERTSFSVRANTQQISHTLFSLFVLPGDAVEIQAPDKDRYVLEKMGIEDPARDGLWKFFAPDKAGLYPTRVINIETLESITVNIIVMVPASEVRNGLLNGYKIGSYPQKPLKNLPIYQAPAGYVEITPENKYTKVSPHFRLGQFLCKQSGSYPKYVVLEERLLTKLEALLARANEDGISCSSFHVMSGYRTPHYNRSIGNVAYSRHQWGDAADIFVDQNPPDGVMDDLNQDGKIDKHDSDLLIRLIEQLDLDEDIAKGGIGSYKSNKAHGPFVHIDARGVSKRW
jgi:hypothetical protein